MYIFGTLIFFFFISPFVYFWSHSSAPVAYPIAKILDYVLGTDNHHTYKKAELKSFLQFHQTGEEPLRDDELAILNAVLELNTKNIEVIMTPLRVRRLVYNLLWIHPKSLSG